MEPSPAAAVTRFLIRFGRPLLRRHPAGGASAPSRSASATSRSWRPWPPVAPSAGPGGVVRLTLASPAQGRYALVWLTKLPPEPIERDPRFSR